MCGIHLVVDFGKSHDDQAIQKMGMACAHRGDQLHFYQQTCAQYNLFWAHNLYDTRGTATVQPIHDALRTMVYNGEIYHFDQDLPNSQASDTLLLWQWLQEDTITSRRLGNLDGMYSILYFDQSTHLLTLIRDPLGIKPLYYYHNEDFLICSSEIKAIQASGLVDTNIRADAIQHFLPHRVADFPHTFFGNIVEATRGITQFDLSRNQRTLCEDAPLPKGTSLASLDFTKKKNQELTLQKIDDTIRNSVGRQYQQAGVPVGLFLSGGVDSTLILAQLQALGHSHVPCFGVRSQHDDQDALFAQKASEQYGGEWYELVLDDKILEGLPTFWATIDQPIADGAMWLTFLLSRFAKEHVQVALSGAGADELFAGYNRHKAFWTYLQKGLGNGYQYTLVKALQALPTLLLHRHLRKGIQGISRSPQHTFLQFESLELEHLLRNKPSMSTSDWDRTKDPLRQALDHELLHFLSLDVLKMTDEASMKSTLEVRVPYLSQELIGISRALPSAWLMQKGPKWILKRLLDNKGGQIFTRRKKRGFGMPFGQWMRQSKWGYLLEPLLDSTHVMYQYLDYKATNALIQKHLKGSVDFGNELWALMSLAYFLTHGSHCNKNLDYLI